VDQFFRQKYWIELVESRKIHEIRRSGSQRVETSQGEEVIIDMTKALSDSRGLSRQGLVSLSE